LSTSDDDVPESEDQQGTSLPSFGLRSDSVDIVGAGKTSCETTGPPPRPGDLIDTRAGRFTVIEVEEAKRFGLNRTIKVRRPQT
jgi:hypothetical protein